MKPDVRTAMLALIARARAIFPFDTPASHVCGGDCAGCSVKLLEYLDAELTEWECRLAEGERPGLADFSRLARTSRKIHRVLVANGILVPESVDAQAERGE
jgi:hypothetical protein